MARKFPPGEMFTIRIRVTVTLISCLAFAVFLGVYFGKPAWRDETLDVSAFLGGVTLLYAAYMSGATVIDNAHRHRADRTFELLDRYNDLEVVRARMWLRNHVEGKDLNTEQMYRLITHTDNEDQYCQIMSILGFFEDMAIAIEEKHVDEDTLFKSLGFAVPWFFDLLKPFISEFRQKQKANTLFVEVETLRNRWSDRRRTLHL